MQVITAGLAAPEGPVVLPSGEVVCVEMTTDTSCVTRVAAGGGRSRVSATGGRPNGLTVDGQGRFWVAGGPALAVSCWSPEGEHIATFDCPDTPLLFPNDIAFGPDDALYVTDTGWPFDDLSPSSRRGIRDDFRSLPFQGGVIRLDPKTGASRRIVTGLTFANGLAFDPAGELFVNETLTGAISHVSMDGVVTPYANVLEAVRPHHFHGPDGMAFAADGSLYVAVIGDGEIAVVPPGGGKPVQRLSTPGKLPTNVAFALSDEPAIYITEVQHGVLLRAEIDRAGLPLYCPSV